jgi:hypothetical protein
VKTATSFLAALLLVGGLGVNSAFAAADGVISNAMLVPGNYCHLAFPAIREDSLGGDRAVLKNAGDGDIIDFYGPCDHDPLAKDEIASQKRQNAIQYGGDND